MIILLIVEHLLGCVTDFKTSVTNIVTGNMISMWSFEPQKQRISRWEKEDPVDTDENDPRHPYYARYDFPGPIPKTGNNHHVSGYVFVLAGCKLFHHQKIVFEMIQAYHRAEHEQDDNSNDSDFGFRPFFTTKSAGNIMLPVTNIVTDL